MSLSEQRASASSPSSEMAAAIANAVYHTTGVRVRSLPISVEKMASVRREAHDRGEWW